MTFSRQIRQLYQCNFCSVMMYVLCFCSAQQDLAYKNGFHQPVFNIQHHLPKGNYCWSIFDDKTFAVSKNPCFKISGAPLSCYVSAIKSRKTRCLERNAIVTHVVFWLSHLQYACRRVCDVIEKILVRPFFCFVSTQDKNFLLAATDLVT